MTPTNEILKNFKKISQIPRCSGNEAAICQWLSDWAKNNGFAVKTDKVQNLLIKIPASTGYENAPIVVLQGHLDMVCEQTPEALHDFTKDPIQLIYDGDWLRADKTTLGADNGIAIAIAMTLAQKKDVPHPPLELLFTVDEETGLHGAAALESGFFDGRCLINIDSEQEGCLTVGCAGGINTDISLPITWAKVPTDYQLMKINAGGMSGGHSGIDINAEKANAIKVLAQSLHLIRQQMDIRLVHFNGGTAHNAIPRDSETKIFVPQNDVEKLMVLEKTLKAEYQNTEPNLFIKVEASDETFSQAIENSDKVIDFLMALPHGVAAMSTDIEGLVETSNNLATVSIEAGHLKILSSQRSSVESKLEALTERVEAVARLVGGKANSGNRYPAWQPNMASSLLAKSCQIYENLFDKKPVVEILHAGLECGIIGKKVPGMDMISIGPTIKYAHSPDEKIHLGSIGKVWDFLLALLKELN